MSKKNLLSIISDKKSRTDRGEYAAWGELATLHSGFSALISPEPYQISLHVVAIASCIEALSRSCLKILIDNENSPYLERAKKFKDLTFDFDLTKALSRKEITFGDLISHNVSISSADQILKHFDTLFSGDAGYRDFKGSLSEIREFVEPPEEEIMGNPAECAIRHGDIIVKNPDKLIGDIQDIFSARHIAAHEANFKLVNSEQLQDWFESAMLFANATYEIVEQKIRPGASRTAFGSSIQALQNLGPLHSSINDMWHELVERWKTEWNLNEVATEELWTAIKESETAFESYLEKEVNLHFQRVGMISANGYRHLEAMIEKMLLEAKLSYLKQLKSEI